MTLKENESLFNYLKNKYGKSTGLSGIVTWQSFGLNQYKLIEELSIKEFKDYRGIEQLTNLKKVIIKDSVNLEVLKKCPNLEEIEIELTAESNVDMSTLIELSNLKKLKIYGRGVQNISFEDALSLNDNTIISYYPQEKLNPSQFSEIQKRLSEIASLIPKDASDFDKVKIIYENLLTKDFKYDDNNLTKDGNGYLINNTMFGPLVMNTGVCSGITLALDVALQNAGLQTNICGGWLSKEPKAGYSHQWNQVIVDGEWYNLDLTSDFDKKQWQFFLKSDNDPIWMMYHSFDKNDKSEVHQNCISQKYNNLKINTQTKIDALLAQKAFLEKSKRDQELAEQKEIALMKLAAYRKSVLAWYNEYPDVIFISDFQVFKNFDNEDKCRHTLRVKNADGISSPVLEGEFDYDENFKTMLEVMVRDFSERNNPKPEDIEIKEEVQLNEIGEEKKEQTASVNIKTENENELNIEGIDMDDALQYQEQMPKVAKEENFKRVLYKKEENGYISSIFIVIGVIILGIILSTFVI